MTNNRSCPINSPDLSGLEIVRLLSENGGNDYQQAMEPPARGETEQRFEEYVRLSCKISSCAGSPKGA